MTIARKKGEMMQFVGGMLILNAIAFLVWWMSNDRPSKWQVMVIGAFAIIAGVFLIVSDRAVEISFFHIGTIKAAAKKAEVEAEEIEAIRKRMEKQAELLAGTAAKAEELEKLAAFSTAVLSAQCDNRPAWDQLINWSEDKDFQFNKLARRAFLTVMEKHDQQLYLHGFSIGWANGADPSKYSIIEYQKALQENDFFYHPAIFESLVRRSDISRRDKLAFLVEVIRSTESMRALEYAGRNFCDLSGQKFRTVAATLMIEWWTKNKDSVKD